MLPGRCASGFRVAVFALLLFTGCGPRVERVVLVTIDTLRADYVGAYGSPSASTPTLDEMARRGIRFETAIAPTPLTLPSHTSLMTGLDPPGHGVHSNAKFRLDDDIPTLAERFGSNGFATAAFIGALVLDRRYGLDRGFDFYDDHMGYATGAGSGGGFAERSADRVVDAALAWLETAPEHFFLWIHLYDPHANYEPPSEFRPPPQRRPGPAAVGFLPALAASLPPSYAGEIAFSDAQLGRLLDVVYERWDPEATLVVATSDHGESLGEHGEITHSLTLYDATQRVPLLMQGPGIPPGAVVSAPVRLVDVAPTLLALCGLRPLPGTAGRDLGPWIRGERDDPLDAYVETLATHLDYGWSPIYGLRTARYKYLRTVRPELYDLADDPGETRNLASQRSGIVRELDALLTARLDGARPVRPNVIAPPEEQRLLEGLGYLVRDGQHPPLLLGQVGGPDPKDRIHAIVAMLEANWHLGQDRPGRALEVLDSAPEAGGWIAYARANAALELGDAARAERYAREMVTSQPHYEEGYLALGKALEAQGRTAAARGAYAEAVRVNPEALEAVVGLGRLAEAEGDLEAAATQYRRGMDARAPSADAALRLAALRFDQDRPQAATRILAVVGDARGAPSEVVIRLARAQARAGQREAALQRLRRSISMGPDREALEAAYRELGGEATLRR